MTRAHFMNLRVCDGVSLAAGQGATDAMWLLHMRREQRRRAARIAPSLRVACQCGVCGVVGLAKGSTIGFALRLAAIRIGRQRIARGLLK